MQTFGLLFPKMVEFSSFQASDAFDILYALAYRSAYYEARTLMSTAAFGQLELTVALILLDLT